MKANETQFLFVCVHAKSRGFISRFYVAPLSQSYFEWMFLWVTFGTRRVT